MADDAERPPAVLSLLADPCRWRIMGELAQSDRRVAELTRLVGMPQNLVSYHLGKLRVAGVVTGRRSAADGRDTYYRADLSRCRDLLAGAGIALHPGLGLGATTPSIAPRRRGTRTPRVLFLCTGNSARSQMAEAMLVARTGGAVRAASAGSHPKPVHPLAVAVMADRGIDISRARSKQLGQFAAARFDRVVTLCDKVREVCPEFPGATKSVHWSTADPATVGGDRPAFEALAADLDHRIELLVAEIVPPLPERTSS